MYVENTRTRIDGHTARIGWVTFSKTAKTIYYRGRTLSRIKGGAFVAIIPVKRPDMSIGCLV